MNKIASISRDKHPSIEPLWQIGKREILISSYYLRRGRQQNISKINTRVVILLLLTADCGKNPACAPRFLFRRVNY